eukprot:58619-Karenia_brevis.AAC.1
MGEYPGEDTNLTKLPKCVPPEVYWAGAQHYLGQVGLSGRVVVIDHEGHRPVGVSHLHAWMHEHGKLLQELGSKSPYVGSNTNQAKGLSHPGKGPATGIGQPYVICQH